MASFVIYNHRANVTRLMNGTENRISFKKKVENEEANLLSRYATVETGVNFRNLREVIVIK